MATSRSISSLLAAFGVNRAPLSTLPRRGSTGYLGSRRAPFQTAPLFSKYLVAQSWEGCRTLLGSSVPARCLRARVDILRQHVELPGPGPLRLQLWRHSTCPHDDTSASAQRPILGAASTVVVTVPVLLYRCASYVRLEHAMVADKIFCGVSATASIGLFVTCEAPRGHFLRYPGRVPSFLLDIASHPVFLIFGGLPAWGSCSSKSALGGCREVLIHPIYSLFYIASLHLQNSAFGWSSVCAPSRLCMERAHERRVRRRP